MSFVYCRVKLNGCMGVSHIDDTERWKEISGSDCVCPNCIAASKPREKRVISGGTVFDPVELEAGGRVVVDRQKSLFGDE